MTANITLKDMASILGVSISTVSKALSDSPEIGKETKAKVNELASIRKYKRNRFAYGLRSNKTSVISVVVPSLNSLFISNLIEGITYEANKHSYKIMVHQTKDVYTSEVEVINSFSDANVDGLIVSPISNSFNQRYDNEHLTNVMQREIPMVMFNNIIDSISCDKVISNHREVAYKITSDLLNSGLKQIAFVSDFIESYASSEWKQGFIQAFNHLNLGLDDKQFLSLTKIDKKSLKHIDLLLKNRVLDAVVCTNDTQAAQFIAMANKHKLSIPEDLAIVSFNSGELAQQFSPSITGVSRNGYYIGRECATLLIRRIQEGTQKRKYITKKIASTVTYRETTLPAHSHLSISA